MCRTRLIIIFFAVAAVILTNSSLVFAQATRTWVSGVGDDANPCSRTAPCKTWAGAISKTAVGGEIDALDPGGFGALTITKAITLDGGGQLASILVAGTNGIAVAAGSEDVVIIRGLRFDGLGTKQNTGNAGLTGVQFESGAVLYVEKCIIFGFQDSGLSFVPNQSTNSQLFVSDTNITNNSINNTTAAGINLQPTGGGKITVTIERSRVEGNTTGLIASDNVEATVSNSIISGNSENAISVTGGGQVNVENCILSNNTGAGVYVDSKNAAVLLDNNTIVNNGTGLSYGKLKGSITSSKTNVFMHNSGGDGTATSTVSKK
ncbi:MAG: right-handed parallel beta-helix repeat-containing protein [Syntrophobacteraceae bacterium]